MRRIRKIISSAGFVLFAATNALATDEAWTSLTYVTYIMNDSQSPAHVVQIGTNFHANCDLGGSARFFIDKEDKDLVAAVMAASVQHKQIYLGVDRDWSVPVSVHATIPSPMKCKVFSLIVP